MSGKRRATNVCAEGEGNSATSVWSKKFLLTRGKGETQRKAGGSKRCRPHMRSSLIEVLTSGTGRGIK